MTDLTKEDADFLKEYIEKEEWRIDKYGGDDDLEDIGFEEDEAFLERNERFESDYRFRFQVLIISGAAMVTDWLFRSPGLRT